MTQLKNAKVLPKGDKLFLIDAPEKPDDKAYRKTDDLDGFVKADLEYYEALSKAPTWEIKNRDEARFIIFSNRQYQDSTTFDIWQPEQGKLYDIPDLYTYRITCWPDCKDYCAAIAQKDDHSCKNVAILIPQEEVKGESQDELFQELWHTFGLWNGVQKAKAKFKITRL